MKRAVSMRRPTTWTSSPRRTTSTSGSSGILLRVAVMFRDCSLLRGDEIGCYRFDRTGQDRLGPAGQLGPGDLGGHLLRFLLAAAGARSHQLRTDPHLGVEALLVVRAFLGDVILRHPQRARGG